MTSAVRVSCGLYKIVLLTYPRDFRRRFGSEMTTTFSEMICGEWESKGLAGIMRVWWFALREVFSVAVRLHLQSPIVVATSLSVLSSVAMFTPCRTCAAANRGPVQKLKDDFKCYSW
jgi:hypothetical protein